MHGGIEERSLPSVLYETLFKLEAGFGNREAAPYDVTLFG